jgi:hypothetical protein
MGINFPNAPAVGELHPTPPQAGVPQYRWDGVAWVAQSQDQLAFVKRTGDTMSGALTLPADPAAALQAATKQYVDAKSSLYISDNPPVTPPDGSMWWDSDNGLLYIRYNDGAGPSQWVQAVATPAIDTSVFVSKAGDTMGGDLTLKGNPTAALHAVPKQYVDPVVSRFQRISLAGLGSVDVQVPAGAVMARIAVMLSITTAAPSSYLMLQLSVAAGVFRNTIGDYQLNGFHASTAPGTTSYTSANNNIPGMFLTQTVDAVEFPVFVDGLISLRRKSTTAFFAADTRSENILAAAGHVHTFYQNLLHVAAAGSALSVLAFRLTSSQPTNLWGAESYLNVEWM